MSKKRIFDIIQVGNISDLPSRTFDILLSIVIVLNISATFMQTFETLSPYKTILDAVETVTVVCFIAEYILRIWTAEYLYPNESKSRAVIRFLYSFDGIVDLLSIVPLFALSGVVAFRMLRVVRIFHLFRINAYMDSFLVIKTVLWEKRNQIVSSVLLVLILMLASSMCIYSVEHEVQPEQFANAFSGLYWSMSTLLTVGYGDLYPITTLGKALTMVIELLGVGLVAIPTGIISAGFVEQYSKAAQDRDDPSKGVELQTVYVDIDSRWLGCTAEEMRDKDQVVLVMIQRGSSKLIPDETYRVQMGDALIVHRLTSESLV